jgi:broad specificity phosphatase PhoE
MPLIYFVRHGQTDWNAARRLQGTTDVPVNAKGRAQAKRNGGILDMLLADKSAIDFVSSPLLRARQTMDIVREAMGLPPQGYRVDERLQEINFGVWSGFTLEQIQTRDPGGYAERLADTWRFAPEGGEAYSALSLRVVDWLSSVERDTVAVAHGGVSRCLRGYVLDLTPAEIIHLDVPQDKVLIVDGNTVTWV